MKLNFKKIASVLTSTVMLSSTVALAAAANYPAPFVQGGNANVAVVYGANAAITDVAAVVDITANLQAKLAEQTATGGSSSNSGTTVSGGDFVKLERPTDKFNLGETMDDFYSSLGDDELSQVLADGIYENEANNEFDFTQKIELGALPLQHFQDTDFNDDKPAIGFNLNDGDHILNYTLDFTDAAEGGTSFADFVSSDLTLLGRNYFVAQATGNTNGVKLTLLDTANSAIVSEGETKTVTVGDKSYDVQIVFIDDNEVIFDVGGTQTNKLQEGDVFKIAEDTYIALKADLFNSKDTGVSQAEFSVGTGKIVIENGQELEINNEDVSDLDKYNDAVVRAYITNSSTDIDKIVLSWNLGDDTWIAPGSEIILPGFETIKISMADFVIPSMEETTLDSDGDNSIKLSTEVEDGTVDFNLLYGNQSNWVGTGKDANNRLVTSSTSTIIVDKDTDNWFVASWLSGDDAESYVLEISDITDSVASKNTTKIKSVASGSSLEEEVDLNQTADFGRVRLYLQAASEVGNNVTLIINASSGSGTVSFDRLYTKDGLRLRLPVNATIGDGSLNLTGAATYPTSWIMNVTEEDEDGNIGSGGKFTTTLGLNADGDAQVSSVSVTDYETEDNSDKFEGYVNSSLATKTLFDNGPDQQTLSIEYHGEESYGEVFVSEAGAAITAGEGTTTSGGSVKVLGSVSVSDSEAGSVSNKNLVVVGGSCINSVAASLLGGSFCGADFTAKTGVGSGSFLIQTFSRSGGTVATLVAGYNAPDTTNAAKYLVSQTVDTTVGKKYKGTSGTSATLETSTA